MFPISEYMQPDRKSDWSHSFEELSAMLAHYIQYYRIQMQKRSGIILYIINAAFSFDSVLYMVPLVQSNRINVLA